MIFMVLLEQANKLVEDFILKDTVKLTQINYSYRRDCTLKRIKSLFQKI